MFSFVLLPFKSLFSDSSISLDTLFFSILLISIPIALITGPALPDIFLSLIAIYFLVISIFKKDLYYFQNPIFFGFMLFSFYSIVRSLFSEMPIESLTTGGSIFYFRYIFFAMGVWYLLDKNPHLSKCLLNILFLSVVIVSLDGIYQYFFDYNILGFQKHSPDRLTGLFNDEPIIGRYVAYLSMFTIALINQNYKKSVKVITISMIFMMICEIVVFLSGERSALFYLIFFSILLILFTPHIRLYRIISILFSIVIIFSFVSINPNAKLRIINLTSDQLKQTQFPLLPYSAHHEEHFVSALKMFSDKPIFGVGTNLFRYKCNEPSYVYKDRSCSTHPHNFYIQILAELGIVGFIILTSFFIYLFYFSSKNLRKYFSLRSKDNKFKLPELSLYLIIMIIYWWPLIPHMGFYNNWNNVLMMLPLGFLMRYLYSNSKDEYFSKN